MLHHANIIVTCTKLKSRCAPAELHLREATGVDEEEGFQDWTRRLQTFPVSCASAADLYSGGIWSVVRTLDATAAKAGLAVRLWACSAGYGLIPLDAPIKPYSATFSPTHEDSVCRWASGSTDQRAASSRWWHRLSQWAGPSPGQPRSIAQLAEGYPRIPILLAASDRYLKAIIGDVRAAASALADPDLLSIISVGAPALVGLEKHRVPGDARLQHLLGGALRSINVRLARRILCESGSVPLRAGVLQERYSRLLEQAPDRPTLKRTVLTDDEIRQFIRVALGRNPTAHQSPLLRHLRDSGRACEQGRFRRLYREVRAKPARP